MVVASLASIAVWAQSPAPSQTQNPQQGTRFTSAIDFVRRDVTPRDAKTGQFIPNLTKDDFILLEDGVVQKIDTMTLVHGGRVINDVAPIAVAPPAGVVLPPARPPIDSSGRLIVIFIDDLHFDFRLTSRVRQLLKQMSDYLIHEGDLWTAVSTGYSSVEQGLTYDRKRINEVVSKVQGAGLKSTDLVNAQSTANGPAEVRYRANTAFSTAYDLLKQLEKVTDRRKTFLYVSSGYDFNPFPEARKRADARRNSTDGSTDLGLTDPNPVDPSLLTNPFEERNNQLGEADLVNEMAELTRQANRANVTFYAIDPRGLTAGPDLDEREVNTTEYMDNVRKTQDTLRVISDLTGGFAVVNQNDFVKALKRIDAETSDYYVLGYYSNNPDPLKRVRKVEIEVKRPNTDLTYVKQYTLKPPPKTIK
jgi:VWFA-related protein